LLQAGEELADPFFDSGRFMIVGKLFIKTQKSAYDAATMLRRSLQKTRLLVLLFLFFTTIAAFAGETATEAPLLVKQLGKATVALDGDWEFRLGDNQSWSSPNFDDSGWEHLHVDRPWGDPSSRRRQPNLRSMANRSQRSQSNIPNLILSYCSKRINKEMFP
jgi:hypothetical protein